jgi:hypothetical protein
MTNNRVGVRRIGLKGIFGVASCLIGLAVVYFGFGVGTESPKKEASASANAVGVERRQRPVHAMNVALGNMVFLAQDLGFSVRNAKDSAEANRIAGRIESQLQEVREQYRQEVVKNPTLAGSLTLQFNIAPSGEVSQVRELSSRLNDGDFKKAISAAVSNWSFAEMVDDNLTVTCPLLFVHEGMDITTLVLWEKSLSNSGDKPALARAPSIPTQQAKVTETAATAKTVSAAVEKKGPAAAATPIGKQFQIKYPSSLRMHPNFSSASLATFTIGTKLMVVGKQGEWLEVQSANNGPRGFIRQEFVVPVEVARK